MRTIICLLMTMLLMCNIAIADQWSFKKERKEKTYTFGASQLVLVTDTMKNQQYPDFTLSIYTNGQLMAMYKGIVFEYVFADKNNSTFVALSNSGLPGSALVIFHSNGKLSKLLHHEEFVPDYCSRSVSISKEWVNEENPAVEFSYKSICEDYEYVDDVTFIDCHGKRVSLMEAEIYGFERRVKEYRDMEAKKIE